MIYEVGISELTCYYANIVANSKEEALKLVQQKYYNGEINVAPDGNMRDEVYFYITGEKEE